MSSTSNVSNVQGENVAKTIILNIVNALLPISSILRNILFFDFLLMEDRSYQSVHEHTLSQMVAFSIMKTLQIFVANVFAITRTPLVSRSICGQHLAVIYHLYRNSLARCNAADTILPPDHQIRDE